MKEYRPYDLIPLFDHLIYVVVNITVFVACIKYIFWG